MTISVTWYVVNYFWWDIWPCIHCQHLLPVTLQRICWFFFWTFEAFVFIIFFSIGVISTYKTSWKIHTTIHCFCFTVSSIYGMRKKFDPQAPSTRTSILVLTPSRMDNGLLKFSSINSPPFSTRSHTQTHTQTHTHTHTHTDTYSQTHKLLSIIIIAIKLKIYSTYNNWMSVLDLQRTSKIWYIAASSKMHLDHNDWIHFAKDDFPLSENDKSQNRIKKNLSLMISARYSPDTEVIHMNSILMYSGFCSCGTNFAECHFKRATFWPIKLAG